MIFDGFMKWWRARQRRIDLDVLWPACKQLAPDLDRARAAFAVHAFRDRAWLALGEVQVHRLIDGLK